jgi:hypothetical protein
MPNVWRIRLLADAADHAAAHKFATEQGIVGAGWGLTQPPAPPPLPDLCNDLRLYIEQAKLVYPNDTSLEGVAQIIGSTMQVNDFCWTYFKETGEYWCCRIIGEFAYRTGRDFDTHDLHITRSCTWRLAGAADAVPGVVRRAFAGPFGVVSPIRAAAEIAAKAAELVFGLRKPTSNADLFAVAGPEELEDLVALYLQKEGWFVLPSTAKISTASYEFVLVHGQTGKRAGLQVKSGNVAFLDQQVARDFDFFFIFMANRSALLTRTDPRIKQIGRDEIVSFARQNWMLLPRALQARWPIN